MRRAFVLLGVTALVSGPLAACGGTDEVACGPVTHEALDPNSGLHVLPDQDVPRYATDPPTSGAHYSLPPPTGFVDEPIDRPLQVTALESGRVLVQYRDRPEAEVTDLEAFAGDGVVVAPNPDQAEPVVLTAWLTKQTCAGLDPEAIGAFIADQSGRGPGVDF